ncbi:CKLF-like MARVEL transmembrane domain-containing protein 4 [Glandiceps talaboti]
MMAEDIHNVDIESLPSPDTQREITTAVPPITTQNVRVRVDYSYLRTAPGALKLLQIMFTIASLVCVTTASYSGLNYLSLPLAGRSRFFVFTSVVSLLATTAIVFFHSTGLSRRMPINWHLFDFLFCLAMCFLYLVASSLIGSACVVYQNKYSDWAAIQLPTGVILGYVCLVLYAIGAVLAFRRWKCGNQFSHRRLESKHRGSASTNVVT